MNSRRVVSTLMIVAAGFALCPAGYAQRLEEGILRTRKTVQAVLAQSPIQIDGRLDETAWQSAPAATDFIQAEPQEGWPATERTEVNVLYDDESIYFGVRCFDSGTLTVHDLKLDFNQDSSDTFGIVLDTFGDERNGYLFVTNPAGAKRDSQFVNEGRNEDVQWDGVWYVATTRAEDGWTAEIRIPFNTVRFSSNEIQRWGINFSRRVRRKNEMAYWSFLPRRYSLNRVSLAGHVSGLESVHAGRNFKVKPYAKSSFHHASGQDTDADFNAGLDVKYGIVSGLTLDATLRPDFSETEVDAQRVNLTRFGLFFPEKRDFFLENSGIFHFGDGTQELGPVQDRYTRLFYSRKIGLSASGEPIPILAGARLTGQVGRLSMGLLNMQTEDSDKDPGENFTATRLKWNLFGNSDMGGIFVNRQVTSSGGHRNRAFGLDANFRFFGNLTVTSYLAKTGTPGRDGKDWAEKLSVEWKDNFMRAQAYYSDIGENFNPETGFVQRTGAKFNRVFLQFYPRPPRNRFLRELAPHFHTRYFVHDGRTLTKEIHFGYIEARFQNGSVFEAAWEGFFDRLSEPFLIRPTVPIPPGDYGYHNHYFEYQSDRSRRISGNVLYKPGTHYDGTRKSFETGIRFQPGEHLATDITYTQERVRQLSGAFTTGVAGLKVSYAFNTRTFLDALVQYNKERKQLSSNIRFRLIHRPLSDLILVYNEERGVGGLSSLVKTAILKYTHMLEF